ncbi:MAG: flagellar protein FlgN [Nitrospira sp.]|nr:flagellar protein FlgN [Nitrospira sp.]
MSTAAQHIPTETASSIHRLLEKLKAFRALLLEEQDAIRSLSFGQFTSVTQRKSQLLDEMRALEQDRRDEATQSAALIPSPSLKQQEADLVAAIGHTDQLNRFNAALIGQSLEFLQGTLCLWQRSPQSAALYSSSGTVVAGPIGMVRAKG